MIHKLPPTTDCLVVGGGVVGLSIAYELAGRGVECVVVDRQQPGREASWAGAGMLPPGSWYHDEPQLEELARQSAQITPRWSQELLELTGIDNEWRVCGATYLATTHVYQQHFAQVFSRWSGLGIEVQRVTSDEIRAVEPALGAGIVRLADQHPAFYVPGEGQLRNPRHVAALIAGCERRGVRIAGECEIHQMQRSEGGVSQVVTSLGACWPRQVVIAAGAWSAEVGALVGVEVPTMPVKGQIVLFEPLPPRVLRGHVHIDSTYALSRQDGRILIGATIEHAGFDKEPRSEVTEQFAAWGRGLSVELANAKVQRAWAGLRPGTPDGLPYIGPLADLTNAWIATGHFRAGLQFASGTAEVIADSILGEPLSLDLHPFRFNR